MFIEHLQKYPEDGLSALSKLNNCSVFITSFSLFLELKSHKQNKNKHKGAVKHFKI